MRWTYSLLLPVALLLVIVTFIAAPSRPDTVRIQVVSAMSGDVMPGAIVAVGPDRYLTDDRGEVVVERPPDGAGISAQVDGFARVEMPSRDTEDVVVIQMQPYLVSGVVKDAVTGQPVAGADIELIGVNGDQVAATRSDSHGAFIFKRIPQGAVVRVRASGYVQAELSAGSGAQLDVSLTSTFMRELGFRVADSVLLRQVDLLDTRQDG